MDKDVTSFILLTEKEGNKGHKDTKEMISTEFQMAFLPVNTIKISLLGSNENTTNSVSLSQKKNLFWDTGMEEFDISHGNTKI
jgi:hypothetical protein